MKTKNSFNESDKIFLVFAMWVALISLLATALTLPMLPDKVTIFYKTTDAQANYYGKYNNLLNVFWSIIPLAVLIMTAVLKSKGKAQRNFPSILLFCIMLSVCMSGVTIYGINQQFIASGVKETIDDHTLICVILCFLFSMLFACIPSVTSTAKFKAFSEKRKPFETFAYITLNRYWSIGAFGFMAVGALCAFLPVWGSYIPFGVFFIFEVIFTAVKSKNALKHKTETLIYDQIDS